MQEAAAKRKAELAASKRAVKVQQEKNQQQQAPAMKAGLGSQNEVVAPAPQQQQPVQPPVAGQVRGVIRSSGRWNRPAA